MSVDRAKNVFPEPEWATDFSKFVSVYPDFLSHSTYHEMAYSIHISLRNKLIFFEIPKNASSSVKTMLHHIEYDNVSYSHSTQADLHSRSFSPLLTPFQVRDFGDLLADPSFLKFCIFRDPFERLVSAYRDKIVVNGQFHQEIRSLTGTRGTEYPSFKEFLYWIANQKVSDMDSHWRPQYLQSYLYAVPSMRVLSMDRMADINTAIKTHLGTDKFSLGKIAPHATTHKVDLKAEYDEPSADLVRKKFSEDFVIWNKLHD